MNMYEFFRECEEEGIDADEALNEWSRIQAENRERFYEDYYNDPIVQAGWAQQDVIDMYRRER